MNSSMFVYHEPRINADLIRRQLRYPVVHGYNLPSVVDLRRWMTEIEDQGDMGSCVANAIAGKLCTIQVYQKIV